MFPSSARGPCELLSLDARARARGGIVSISRKEISGVNEIQRGSTCVLSRARARAVRIMNNHASAIRRV
jgi:hypothetical protein